MFLSINSLTLSLLSLDIHQSPDAAAFFALDARLLILRKAETLAHQDHQ